MYNLIQQAKIAERNNDWDLAARLWKLAGKKDDARACDLIAESNAKGDAFREDVEKLTGNEPHENSFPEAYKKWHEDLKMIYDKHYKK